MKVEAHDSNNSETALAMKKIFSYAYAYLYRLKILPRNSTATCAKSMTKAPQQELAFQEV